MDAKWIPCTERLPDTDDIVLVTVEICFIREIDFGQYIERAYPDGAKTRAWEVLECENIESECKVIAWMPLPDVYVDDIMGEGVKDGPKRKRVCC